MDYLLIGAGAIGTYIGASLAHAGCKVSFLERAEFTEQLRQTGVKLKLPASEIVIPKVEVFSNPQQAFMQKYDVVVFAMKSFDTKIAAESLHPIRARLVR